MSKLFLGCDPDLHTCAFATVREDMSIHQVWAVRSEGSKEQEAVLGMIRAFMKDHREVGLMHSGVAAYAVEAQEIYLTDKGRTKNPRNILHLGHISGAVLFKEAGYFFDAVPYFPLPGQWKGQVDKLTHHRRILIKAGVHPTQMFEAGSKDPYCGCLKDVVVGSRDLNSGDWKHVTDAIGLAQYAAERYLTETRKQELLTKVRGTSPGAPC